MSTRTLTIAFGPTSVAGILALAVMCASQACKYEAIDSAPEQAAAIRAIPARVQPYRCLSTKEIAQDRLRSALQRCCPSEAMTMASLLHSLRMPIIPIGTQSAGEGHISREVVLTWITDQRKFEERYGKDRPYLVSTRYGARFSEKSWSPSVLERRTREAHAGQTVCVLAEAGVPSNYPLQTHREALTLSAVLDDTVANFTLDEELYWVTVALALYLDPPFTWTNKYGQQFSFDDVADRLISKPAGESGPCAGTHALYTLAVMLQRDEHSRIFQRNETRERACQYLRSAVQHLKTSQRLDGSWDVRWMKQQPNETTATGTHLVEAESQAIWITGHQLEWQAIVPNELRVPAPQLLAAARFVVDHTSAIPEQSIVDNMCAYSHGLRAVLLMLTDGESIAAAVSAESRTRRR